ncbi:MAG: cupin domain-containing protein, partial [Deltaproteobacteria bacterium]|nr:cupin domain-containing protein [Deltaproteobacteria bacterium]
FLVRLEPKAVIAYHNHPMEWEVHAVTSGSGHCVCGGENKAYLPGTTALMPMGIEHEVRAGADGLTLLAFFSAAH